MALLPGIQQPRPDALVNQGTAQQNNLTRPLLQPQVSQPMQTVAQPRTAPAIPAMPAAVQPRAAIPATPLAPAAPRVQPMAQPNPARVKAASAAQNMLNAYRSAAPATGAPTPSGTAGMRSAIGGNAPQPQAAGMRSSP